MTPPLPTTSLARAVWHDVPTTIPAVPGAYILLINLDGPIAGAFAAGHWSLPSGRYLYCGSARGPGGLRARIARHMRPHKSTHWHIDHLTAGGSVAGVWVRAGGDECALAGALAHLPVPIPGFGSSDCAHCRAHLFGWPRPPQSRRMPR